MYRESTAAVRSALTTRLRSLIRAATTHCCPTCTATSPVENSRYLKFETSWDTSRRDEDPLGLPTTMLLAQVG